MSRTESEHRIDYVEFPATDLEATKRFFRTVFGWTFQDWGPSYAAFDDGRMAGGFRAAEAVAPGGPLVILYAADLEATRDAVSEAGGTVVEDIFAFPGGRRFHFADPNGNVLAVWSDA